MKRKMYIKLIGIVGSILLIGFESLAHTTIQMDTANLDRGIIKMSYKGPSITQVKVMIEKANQKYTYNLNSQGRMETFPLQMGNGDYKVSVLEQTAGTKYRMVKSEWVSLEMDDPNDVYLNSVQNINWDTRMKAIQKGYELMKGLTQPMQKVRGAYGYVVVNYHYDEDKLATLPRTYLPVIDDTYRDKTGICYDFSALYASILRSQGIPVKLVKGYSPHVEGYHAWNEVYEAKTDEWVIVDTTYDLQVTKQNKKVEMTKKAKDYQKVNEY